MTFTKRYITTLDELAQIPLQERFHYYFHRNLLGAKQGFTAQAEQVVGQREIEQAGIMCRPFWDDEQDGKELDSEGRAFAAYRAEHPDFDMMVRRTVLAKLLEAQARLPKGLRIVLKAGVRPLSVQQKVFDDELAITKQKHANWDDQTTYEHTLEYVTDPAASLPPHATGGTVDIHVWDSAKGDYVDVGSPVNALDDSSWGDNQDDLTEQQKRMRNMIRDAMLAAGFANLASEWWHYSYGDQRWAVYYDQPGALYNAVQL